MLSFGSVSVFAQSYERNYPSYVPVSGGAWCEAQTSQGTVCFIVPIDYLSDCFGFSGSGYSVANVTNQTISGTLYAATRFSYYGNPTSLQCRFSSMGTMEVYAPYYSSGYTRYQWDSLPTSAVLNTNLDFVDDTEHDRQNDFYRYSLPEKLLIILIFLVGVLLLLKIGERMWKA